MILFLAALLSQDPTTDLGYIDVKVQRTHPLLSVVVDGQTPEDALIISDPVTIRCGASRFEYSLSDAPRLCWIRRPTGTAITLTARGSAQWGDNWHVEWQGCETPEARSCTVHIGSQDQKITARFVQA